MLPTSYSNKDCRSSRLWIDDLRSIWSCSAAEACACSIRFDARVTTFSRHGQLFRSGSALEFSPDVCCGACLFDVRIFGRILSLLQTNRTQPRQEFLLLIFASREIAARRDVRDLCVHALLR